MPLPRLARYLDPRPSDEATKNPIEDSVNIPLRELPERMHELPPRHGVIRVAGPTPLAENTVAFLQESGREAEPIVAHTTCPPPPQGEGWTYGNPTLGRLWEPNPFLAQIITELTADSVWRPSPDGRMQTDGSGSPPSHPSPPSSLDLACGAGRDAVALAAHSWNVTATDHLQDALDRGQYLAHRYLSPEEAARIEWVRADLESKALPAVLAPESFDLITMFWYLNRDLIRQAPSLLRPNGHLVIETFTTIHRDRYGKPRTQSFVLEPHELLDLVKPLTIRYYEEAWHGDRHSARLWANGNLSADP